MHQKPTLESKALASHGISSVSAGGNDMGFPWKRICRPGVKQREILAYSVRYPKDLVVAGLE